MLQPTRDPNSSTTKNIVQLQSQHNTTTTQQQQLRIIYDEEYTLQLSRGHTIDLETCLQLEAFIIHTHTHTQQTTLNVEQKQRDKETRSFANYFNSFNTHTHTLSRLSSTTSSPSKKTLYLLYNH